MKKTKNKSPPILAVLLVFLLLAIIVFATNYAGSTDIADYSDTAKYFTGDYSAKIRSSHSYLYGFINFPMVKLSQSFFIFKIINLFCLIAIIYSVYIISHKNKKAIWLILLSPLSWYMAPWISPIILTSLILLWAFYFMKKYETYNHLRHLFFSGLLVGLGWVFWDTIFYFGIFMGISFLYDRKLSHFGAFIFAVLLGLSPRLLFDQFFFNFPFYTTIKTFIAGITYSFFGGIYNQGGIETNRILSYLILFISIPFYFWSLYSKKIFSQNKKTFLFLSLSILLILLNPQIRYLMAITPIIALLLAEYLSEVQFKKQILILLPILLLFTLPIILQIVYSIDGKYYADISYIVSEKKLDVSFDKVSQESLALKDVSSISQEFPNSVFIVGPGSDDYGILARIYWGDSVREFVSIQDYRLWERNETSLFEKRFSPVSRIEERRQIWIAGGMSKGVNDKTDYARITYALSLNQDMDLDSFKKKKSYSVLTLYEKE